MKLSEIIKQLEDEGAIKKYYLHHDYYDGALELNIEFNNDDNESIDKVLTDNIEESSYCAYWE